MDDPARPLMGPDGPIRRFLKAIARFSFWCGVRARRWWQAANDREKWALGGDCRRCGKCCEVPSIAVDSITWCLRLPFLWWQRVVNGFELVRAEEPGRVFVFRCLHYDAPARRCDCYETRPGMCRDYPRFQMEQDRPVLLPGCGYHPIDLGKARVLEVLDLSGLSERQRNELKKHLRLD